MSNKKKIILISIIVIILVIASYFIFFRKDKIIILYVEGLDIKLLEEYSEQLPNLKSLSQAKMNSEVPLNNPSTLSSIFSGQYIYQPWFLKETVDYTIQEENNFSKILEQTELFKYSQDQKLSIKSFNKLNWDLEKKIHLTEDFDVNEIIQEAQNDFQILEKDFLNYLVEDQDNLLFIGTNYPALVTQVLEDENQVLEAYQKIDNLIGQMQNLMKKNTKLFIISPFGFVNVDKSIDINNTLVYRGFLKGNYRAKEDYFISDCNLAESFAYSPRAGEIFVNKLGREKFGQVSDDFQAVVEDTAYVLSFIDYEGDSLIDTQLFNTSDYFPENNIGELLISLPAGYSIFWPESENKILHSIIKDTNLKKEHLNIKPSLIPGFVLSNKELISDQIDYLDILKLIIDVK